MDMAAILVMSSAECYSVPSPFFQNLEKIGFKCLRPSNKAKMYILRMDMHYENVFLSK